MDGYYKLSEGIYLMEDAVCCPICGENNIPKYKSAAKRGLDDQAPLIVLSFCSFRDCLSPFLTEFKFEYPLDGGNRGRIGVYFKSELYEYSTFEDDPAEIQQYNSAFQKRAFYRSFVEIYKQAHLAQEYNLDHIAGMGYRKSLEFLLKDYAISIFPANELKIKSSTLEQVIKNNFQDYPVLIEVARRATWLGNDETHYVRKWINKDVETLKKTISLTIHLIEQAEETKELLLDMPDPSGK